MEMKKISSFIGIFLVGLLAFGLASGAGYNVVVPSSDPPSSSGGSGGTIVPIANETVNETAGEETISDDETDGEEEDIIGEIKETISDSVNYIKEFWVWFIVALALVVGAVVTYLRKKKK